MKARALVENPDKLLKAEMYVTAELVGEKPVGVDVSGESGVLAQTISITSSSRIAPGQFERRAVKLGDEHNGRIAVVDGLAPGQRVVTEGSLLLQALLEGGGNA